MPFEIGKAFNGGAEWVCGSAMFGVLRNPVFTALLITAVALVIVYAMYRHELEGTGRRRGVKTAFWLLLAVSALVFVHYYALERSLEKSHAAQGVQNVMNSIHHSATMGGGYTIQPFGGNALHDDARAAAGAAMAMPAAASSTDDEEEPEPDAPRAAAPVPASVPALPTRAAQPVPTVVAKAGARADNVRAPAGDDLEMDEVFLASAVRR